VLARFRDVELVVHDLLIEARQTGLYVLLVTRRSKDRCERKQALRKLQAIRTSYGAFDGASVAAYEAQFEVVKALYAKRDKIRHTLHDSGGLLTDGGQYAGDTDRKDFN
jgi:DNA-binding cell septation regulator SpoVG